MNVFPLLLLLLSTSYVSSRSRAEDVRDNDDVFEDALLEHLNDLQENQEDYGNYMYDDEVEDENDQYSRKRLLHMLDYIKKEASKHQQLKKSIESNADENIAVRSNTKKESDASEPNRNIAKSNDGIETNFKKTISKKEESHDHIEIIDVAKDKRGVSDEITNSQEATVIPDDTIDKQNEIDKTVNLRSVLEPAVTNAPSNTTTASKMPSHGHIKQTITSSKDNKMGLDKVSFIAVVAGCCVAVVSGIALAAYCWCKLRSDNNKDEIEKQKSQLKKQSSKKKKPEKKEQPLSEDEKMVHYAEMYHYQHAKNQMQQLGQPGTNPENFHNGDTSEEEEDDEDTVYECPGLAAPGDMKVVNPLFSDGDSPHHSDKQSETTSYAGTPSPPNERAGALAGQHTPQP